MDGPDQGLQLAMQASIREEEYRRREMAKEATELAIALSYSYARQSDTQLANPSANAGTASHQATRLEDAIVGEDKMDDLEAAIIASISDVEGYARGSGTKSSGARTATPEGHSLRGDSCSNASEAAAKSYLQEWMTICEVSAGARFRDGLFPPTEQSLGELSESALQVQVRHSDGRRSVRRIRPAWASPLDLFPTRQDKSDATTSDEIRQVAIAHAGRSGFKDTHVKVTELQHRMGRGMPLDNKDVELVRVLGASMFQLTRPSGEPSAMDVRQAGLGTCWFVSAMAVACEHEGTIRRLFRQQTLPSHGMLQLQLCVGGEWRVVTIDDCLPTDSDNGTLLFTSGRMQQLWPSYLEKGIAKLSGSFAEAAGGGVGEGLKYLTGAPIEHINTKTCLTDAEEKLRRLALHAASGEGGRSWLPRWLQDQCDERPATEGELWARLLSWSQAGFLVGASCGKVDRDETPDAELQPRYQARGLVFNHAYSILKVVEVPLPLLPERYRRTVSRDRSTMASDAASLRGASAPESGAGTGLGGSVVLRRHSSGELMEVERVVVLRNPWSDASEVGWNGRYGRTWGGVRDSPEVRSLLFGDLAEARDGLFSPPSVAKGAGAASGHSSTIPPGVFGMAFDDFREYFGSADAACARKGYCHARMTAMMPVSLAVDVPMYPAYVVTDHTKSMSATACVSYLCQRMRNGMQVRMAIAQTRGHTKGSGGSVAASAAAAGSSAAPLDDGGASATKVAAEYGWEVSRCEDVGGMADVGCVVVRLAGKVSPPAAVEALNSRQWELADGQHSLPNIVGAASAVPSAASSVAAPVPPYLLRSCPRAMVESANADVYLDKDYTHVIVPLSLGPLTTESAQRLTTSLHGPHEMALTPVMLGGQELAQVLCARSRAIGKAMPLARLGPGCCVWTTGGDSGDVLVVENSNPNVWLQLQVDYSEGSSNVHFSRGSDVTMDYIQPRSRQVLQIASQADSRRGYRLSFKFSAKSVPATAVAHAMASGTFTRNFPSIVAGSVHEHVSAG